MNKYMISADIEGICGVVSKSFANSTGKHYELARKYMVHDINAVVCGILQADAKASIVVKDAHGDACNIDLEKLHAKAKLVQGWGNQPDMLYPLDETYKGVFLVGYHAGGQNTDAVLAHTYSSSIFKIYANDLEINETGIAAFLAGHLNVPIAFISGDNYAVEEAKKQLRGLTLIGVAVKESYGRDCATSLSLVEANELLTAHAKEATHNLLSGKVAPFRAQLPIKTEIMLYGIGFTITVFAKIHGILNFDKNYEFVKEKSAIRFSAATQLEMVQRLGLINELIFAARMRT